MTKEYKKIVKVYLKDISKELKSGLAFKRVFLQATKEKITEYVCNKETLTMDDLYTEFGTPKEVVLYFFDKDAYSKLLAIAKKKTVFWMIISVMLFILLIIAIAFIVKVIDTYGYTENITDVNIMNRG